MANEFIARKGIIALADSTISGSLSVTGTLTGDGSGLTNVTAVQAPGGSNGLIQYNDNGATGGASTLFWDDSNSRLGIGTVSPGTQLEAYQSAGQSNISVNAGGNRAYLFANNGGNWGLWGFENQPFTLATNSQERLRITNTGEVGIGTTTPSYKLDVVGDINTTGYYGIGSNVVLEKTASYTMLRDPNGVRKLYLGGTADQTTYINGDSFRLRNGAGSTVYMAINTGGNVGIGTTNPTVNLHVTGPAQDAAPTTVRIGAGLGYGNAIPRIELAENMSGNDMSYGFSLTADGASSNNLLIRNHSNNIPGNVALAVDRISGNIGIGATYPDHPLHVYSAATGNATNLKIQSTSQYGGIGFFENTANRGTLAFGNDGNIFTGALADSLSLRAEEALHLGAGGNNLSMTITTAGNVGIGTTSTSYKLTVQGGNNGINLSGTGAYLRWNSGDMQIKNEGSYKMGFHTYNTTAAALVNRMVIDTDGNVGINTTTPIAKLQVQSDTADSTVFAVDGVNGRLFSIDDSLSDSLFSVNTIAGLPVIEAFADNTVVMGAFGQNDLVISGSNVGIGTNSPLSKFHVKTANDTDKDQGIVIERSLNTDRGYINYQGGGFQFRATDGDPIVLGTVSNELVRINSNGNVGIGTTAPSAPLSISNGGAEGIELNYNVGNEARILSYNRSNNTYRNLVLDSAYHRFKIFGNEVGSINGSGNVTFNNDLTVGGTITAQEFRAEFITNTIILESGSTQFGDSDDDLHTFQGSTLLTRDAEAATGQLELRTVGSISDGNYDGLYFTQDAGGTTALGSIRAEFKATGRPDLGFYTRDSGVATESRKMIITADGKVGIGTTSPTQKLDVAGKIHFNAAASGVLATRQGYSDFLGYNPTYGSYIGGGPGNVGSRYLYAGGYINDGNGVQTLWHTGNDGAGSGLDADRLDGLQATSFLRSDQSDTFTGTLTVDELSSIMYTPDSGFSYGVSSGTNIFGFSPFNKTWHDLLGFQFNRLTQETYDGTTWTSASLQRDLFIGKEDVPIGVITTNEGVRWTLSPAAYNYGKWLQVSYTYTSPTPTVEVLIETSPDNVTWTDRGTSSNGNNSVTRFYRIDDFGGDNYIRFTLLRTSGTANVNVSSIKLWGARIGDQGEGVEQSLPYSWDADKNIDLSGELRINGGTFLTDDGTSHYVHSASNLYLYSGGSATATLASGGNVGIGTTSPTNKLHVVGNIYASGHINSNQYYVSDSIFHNADTDTKIKFDTDRVRIYAGNVVKFDSDSTYLTTTGKAADSELLDGLNSTSFLRSDTDDTFSGDLLVAATTNTNATTKVEMRDNAVFGIKPNSQNSGTLHFAQVDSGNSIGMQFTNGAGTADWDISMQPFGGRVGIGTVSPGYTLDVAGDIATSGDIRIADAGKGIRNAVGNHIFTTGWSNSLGNSALNVGDYTVMHSGYAWSGDEPSSVMTSNNYPLLVTIGANSTPFETASFYVDNSSNIVAGGNATFLGTNIYGDSTNPSVKLSNSAGAFLQYTTSNRVGVGSGVVTFTTGGGERMRIDSSGNVGIGTTAPAFKLDVSGGIRATGVTGTNTLDLVAPSSYIRLQANANNIFHDAGGNHYFRTAGGASTSMIVTSGGQVGIGTTSPGAMLDVAGQASIDADLFVGADGGANYTASRVRLYSHDNYRGAGMHMTGVDSNWFIGTPYTDFAGSFIIARKGVATSEEDTAQLSNALFTVRSTGRVGIGTTSPTKQLHVYTNDNEGIFLQGSGGGVWMNIQASGGEVHSIGAQTSGMGVYNRTQSLYRMFIDNAGNVGIGTTSTAYKLDVVGTIRGRERLTLNSASYRQHLAIERSGQGYYLTQSGNTALVEATGATDRFDIFGSLQVKSNGNVGIGTTAPDSKLTIRDTSNVYVDIQGDGNVEAGIRMRYQNNSSAGSKIFYNTPNAVLYYDNLYTYSVGKVWGSHSFRNKDAAGTLQDRLYIAPLGNVGIGTTSPNSKLEVYGSGGTVLDIQGSQGQLFSVSDSLTGSLMSVNDISGLPILEVFDTDKVVMGEYGTNALVVTGSNVGIGTDAPIAPLSILATSTGYSSDSQIKISDGSTAYYGGLSFDDTGSTRLSVRNSYDGTNSTIGFGFGGSSDKVQIINGTGLIVNEGNVGIGTTSPGSKLHVEGEIRADFNGTDGSTYMTGYGIEFERGTNYLRPRGADGTQTLHIGGADDSLDWNNVNIKTLSFTVRANGADRFQVGSDVAVVGSTDFNITGASRRLNFTSGTGTVRTTSNNALYLATNNTTRMTITGGGAVGIGTTSPTARFEVEGDGSYTSNIKFKQAGSQEHFLYAATNTQYNLIGSSSPVWAWGQQNGAERMRLDNTSLLPGANPGYYIGSDARRWEIVFCNILDSAGLHEKNLENPEGEKSVGDYATGTVLVWKGGKNVPCSAEADHMRMGIAVEGMASPLVQGAEPVLCTGVVNEGDYIITSDKEGHARGISRQEMLDQNLFDCVLGKALEQGEGESYLLKVWITI